MRFLFVVASAEYLRYYDSVLRLLASRGHDVSIAVNHVREEKQATFEDVSSAVRVLGVVPARGDRWSALARGLRGTFDFVRYLHPDYRDAPALRDRMKRKVLPRPLRWLDRLPPLSPGLLAGVYALLRRLERAVPVSGTIVTFLRQQRPDVVVVSPLIDAASDQVDVVRAARRRGLRVVVGIASWDNLTNKGLLRVTPDLVMVWNEAQKAEAMRYHGIPAARIAVTGAQLFDRWFERTPSTTRDQFCATVGMPRDQPFVLYTASSVFIARSERELPFVRKWIEALRRSEDPRVRDIPVLVRPHPYNWHAWEHADLGDLGQVRVWPRGPYSAVSEQNRSGFFDSMYHSAAVVGVNTSAMIESAIVGRPVFSLTGEFGGTQEGTLHFHHLLPENGGFLRVGHTLDEHVAQLAAVLKDPDAAKAETQRFVASFIRPHGVEKPCTPIVVETLERAAAAPATPPDTDDVLDRGLRLLLRPVTRLIDLWPAPKSKKVPRKGEKPVKPAKTVRAAGLDTTTANGAVVVSDEAHRAFGVYAEVRDAVLAVLDADQRAGANGTGRPSAYWTEELGNIDYMTDATPIILAKLRHHAFHITGLRPYDYRVADDEKVGLFEQRLRTLVELGGPELVVPEHPALGGFGYRIDGQLFNLDGLKYLEVLVGMKRSGVMDAFRGVTGRRVAWEIGGGWGGFAYQFTRLFPDTTYVITDLPELFLFSATYLKTVIPDARTLIVGPATPDHALRDWRGYDFVFVPNTRAASLPGFEPHLLVNIASFQEMTGAQIAAYIDLAARGRCAQIYSLNRERSRYNDELESVGTLLSAHYDVTDVSPLDTDYTRAMKKASKARNKPADTNRVAEALTYRHMAGRLRDTTGT
ncbi:MAG: putative sugar O-methyltransferase [Vicinamibacterales bacterium]